MATPRKTSAAQDARPAEKTDATASRPTKASRTAGARPAKSVHGRGEVAPRPKPGASRRRPVAKPVAKPRRRSSREPGRSRSRRAARRSRQAQGRAGGRRRPRSAPPPRCARSACCRPSPRCARAVRPADAARRHAQPREPRAAAPRPPAEGAQRVTEKDLKEFEHRLLEERQKILKEMGHLENTVLKVNQRDSAGDLSGYSFHMADVGTDAMEREKAFLFASAEGRTLLEINEALRRLYRGEYGICESCGAADRARAARGDAARAPVRRRARRRKSGPARERVRRSSGSCCSAIAGGGPRARHLDEALGDGAPRRSAAGRRAGRVRAPHLHAQLGRRVRARRGDSRFPTTCSRSPRSLVILWLFLQRRVREHARGRSRSSLDPRRRDRQLDRPPRDRRGGGLHRDRLGPLALAGLQRGRLRGHGRRGAVRARLVARASSPRAGRRSPATAASVRRRADEPDAGSLGPGADTRGAAGSLPGGGADRPLS